MIEMIFANFRVVEIIGVSSNRSDLAASYVQCAKDFLTCTG